MNIDTIINDVIKGIDNDWPVLYKIRYVYLAVGKILCRDTDFFFSVDGKLGVANLSIREIKEIYESETGRDYNVICKSASFILKTIYEKLGIKAELIETNTTIAAVGDDDFLINHWFLAAYDDEDKAYFMTLTPDLVYIKLGMETKHFASDIPYEREFNGRKFQIYKGDEIKPTTIPKDELRKIDMDINYIQEIYNYDNEYHFSSDWHFNYSDASLYMLRESLKNNKLYYEIEVEETDFYNNLINFDSTRGEEVTLLDKSIWELSNDDINKWLKILCQNVLNKIMELLGYEIDVVPPINSVYWDYDAWLFNLCSNIENDLFKILDKNELNDYSDVAINVEDFKFNKWSKKVKKKFDVSSSHYNYDNILIILDKMNAIVNYVKTGGKNGHLGDLINSLSYHFIDPANLLENALNENGYMDNYYIANKFEKLFTRIFECNKSVGMFNKMGYSEQIVMIKEILLLMFPEIKYENAKDLESYNDEYNAVLNRIQIYPIKNKETGEYAIIFNILGDNKNGDYYFFYNPQTNEFNVANILDVYSHYIFVSNRLKNRISIDELELMDSQGIKK